MRCRNKICIMLTACVNPNGMAYTALQNVDERELQYRNALLFYLCMTDAPIVFVENTCSDFSADYRKYIDSNRLEYITFEGNNYDKNLGKGYGEALLIKEAFKRSRFLKESKYVVKITGRLVIRNIQQGLSSRLLCINHLFRADLRERVHLWTTLFVIETKMLKTIIDQNIETINDSKGFFFEHAIYNGLIKDKSVKLIPFIHETKVEGVSGTVAGRTYASLMSKFQIQDNLYFTSLFYKEAGHKCTSLVWSVIYRIYLLYKRII